MYFYFSINFIYYPVYYSLTLHSGCESNITILSIHITFSHVSSIFYLLRTLLSQFSCFTLVGEYYKPINYFCPCILYLHPIML